jgi:hypothetical protein
MIVRWLALILLPVVASAQESADPVQRVADALHQGALAEQSGDPKAMAEAARTLDLLGAKPAEGEENAASRWRDLARAGGVSDATETYRGRALGPAYRQGVLAPRATLATEQIFLAGKKAMVSVVPEAGRTLAMRVTAPGEAICAQDVAAPRGVCSWLPVFTRRVEIRLVNQSDRPSHYYLVSN